MTDLLAARSQMAMSLAFHILFAVAGISMPLLMVIAEALHIKTGKAHYLELAKRWSKGTAILFAIGAVSGTVLSFELGLLWPEFMAIAGPLVGMPFSLEGFAFFLEAIFLGIVLYGWDKVPPKVHLACGVGVLICGVLSGAFVVCANGWMNTPTGFDMVDGEVVNIDVWTAMFNPAAFSEALHMTIASFEAVGFLVAGIHAWAYARKPSDLHRSALRIALVVGGVAALIQPLSGDLSARHVAEYQPLKLAAMEGLWETRAGAPLTIGGWPIEDEERTVLGLEIPYALSLLSHHDPDAVIQGLKDFPVEDRPPVAITHVAFQIMVGCGTFLAALTLLAAFLYRRGRLEDPRFLKLLIFASPMGVIALEAGWTVTEVGRQPWVIHGILRTADAVTPVPHLVVPFTLFSALYLVLGVVVITLLRRHVFLTT